MAISHLLVVDLLEPIVDDDVLAGGGDPDLAPLEDLGAVEPNVDELLPAAHVDDAVGVVGIAREVEDGLSGHLDVGDGGEVRDRLTPLAVDDDAEGCLEAHVEGRVGRLLDGREDRRRSEKIKEDQGRPARAGDGGNLRSEKIKEGPRGRER